MKKLLLSIITILFIVLPISSFSFSVFGAPLEVPEQQKYLIYNQHFETKDIPNSKDAAINTTLLVYTIQNQATVSTNMMYIKDHQVKEYPNSAWAAPLSKMLTVSLFEYLLGQNVVSDLAYQDLNIRQDFTLSGTTSYGSVLDLDHHRFILYITFYLKNEKTTDTVVKTFKYERDNIKDDITAGEFASITNYAASKIFFQLKPWLIKNLKDQQEKPTPNFLMSTPQTGEE